MIESLCNLFSRNKKQEEGDALNSPMVLLDIGCRWGFAERFLDAKYHQRMKVFGFDPDAEECARLMASYSNLPDGFIQCIPLALADRPGKRNLFITHEPACSSLYPPIQYLADNCPALECIKLDKIVSVDVDTLANWMAATGLQSIEYIKVDTQGSELDILKGAGEYLKTARCIDIEVEFNPIYEGQCLFWEVDAYLRSNGFMLWRMQNMVHYSYDAERIVLNEPNMAHFDNAAQEILAFGGQLFWADARYVHSSVLFGKYSEESWQLEQDLVLFEVLGMPDIKQHIQRQSNQK